MIFVIATVEVAPGRREDFLTEFHRVVPLVRAEQGCIEYGPTVEIEAPFATQPPPREDVVVIVEKWESLDALKDHLNAPHMHEYRARVKDLVQRVTLQILEPV